MSKVIRIKQEIIKELEQIDTDINRAISKLLQSVTNVTNKGVTNCNNTVTNGVNAVTNVTNCYNKEEINKKLQRIITDFNRFRELDKEEIRQDISSLKQRNMLK